MRKGNLIIYFFLNQKTERRMIKNKEFLKKVKRDGGMRKCKIYVKKRNEAKEKEKTFDREEQRVIHRKGSESKGGKRKKEREKKRQKKIP